MIKNIAKLNKFYKELLFRERIPYKKAMRIYEFLYKEALSLKVISSKNILDGLKTDLKIARILNSHA